MGVKVKVGKVSMVKIFRAFQKAIEKKKVNFTLDETQQNGKLMVELNINKIRTELGFRMKPLMDTFYEKVFESFLVPLADFYFNNFEESEHDELRKLEKRCKKLEEKLAFLEYCKKCYEEDEKKKIPSPTPVTVVMPVKDVSMT